ncbi:MAG: DsbA family protein [Gammaproteobacteria bacterium]|nr:DsbA family protein [Gammaproteobacteria bacterium]
MSVFKLQYFADPMCSWCYGFSPVISRLQHEHGDQLQLDLIMGGLRPYQNQPLPESTRQEIFHHWHEVERMTGQPFCRRGALVPGFVYDTEPACRAVVLLRRLHPQQALAYLAGLQRAFYAEGRDITRHAVLAEIAAGHGADAKAFTAALDAQTARRDAQADFSRTHDALVEGFPTLLLERSGRRALRLAIGFVPYDELCTRLREHELLDAA